MTGFPLILIRSQNRAHPLSCAARITVGADDVVIQDLVPDYFSLFVSKSSDSTSDSDSARSSSVVEEGESGAKRSWHAHELSESESDDDNDDDRGDDFGSTSNDDEQKPYLVISPDDVDRALARGYGCKDGNHSSTFPVQYILSIQCQISRASPRDKILSSLACSLLDSAKRNCRTRTVLVCL